MNISGTATLRAPVDAVYAALTDPAVLVATIPGCSTLEETGPDAYTMVVTAGVASIKGTYRGEVALTDQQPPHAFVLKASGSGAPGTVSAEAKVRLDDAGDGTTTLTYDADAIVGGMVGGVGQRVLSGVARKTANEFFTAVDQVLLSGGLPVAGAPAATGVALSEAPVGPVPSTASISPSTVDGEPRRFVRSAPESRGFPGGDAVLGALVGAGAALAGVVVGALIARRPRRSPRS
jgi:carbon monoxide dehydrogenase subunit G